MIYGLPYKGSKNKIAAEIIAALPPSEYFVDVFAGGCAVSHAALQSGKYSSIVANDINAKFPKLFKSAISGNLPKGYDRHVSREEFESVNDKDAVAACVWSFGSNCQNYLWNKDTEGAKSLAFRLVMSDSRDERARLYAEFIKYLRDKREELKRSHENLERTKLSVLEIKEKLRGMLRDALKKSGLTASAVDRLLGTNGMAGHYFGASQWEFPTREAYTKLREILPLPEVDFFKNDLENLESLKNLERLESLRARAAALEPSGVDYRLLDIPCGALVYCDPPYKGTSGYNGEEFDHAAFWNWCRKIIRTNVLAVSEYSAPSDFVSVWKKNKICTYGAKSNKRTVEQLFIHESQAAKWSHAVRQMELFTA